MYNKIVEYKLNIWNELENFDQTPLEMGDFRHPFGRGEGGVSRHPKNEPKHLISRLDFDSNRLKKKS